ncbi:unnamed protein product, partial [Mesorhabditis belari]|uniref:Cullin family profile domain-containing protein n=1 Tax=Mesorhabditis belari TaxID=2138241 RepID=A0AAF3EY63_9BILA
MPDAGTINTLLWSGTFSTQKFYCFTTAPRKHKADLSSTSKKLPTDKKTKAEETEAIVMNPANLKVDLETIWPDLESGLDDIFGERRIEQKRYMTLYTNVYNHCINTPSSFSDSTIVAPKSGRGVSRNSMNGYGNGSEFTGGELYQRLKNYLERTVIKALQEGKEKHDEELVRFYVKKWEQFRFYFKVIDGIFAYLNKHWIKRQIEDKRDPIYYVKTLGLVTWRDVLLSELDARVMQGVMDLIRQERDGQTIDRSLIRAVVESYVDLGIDEDASCTSRTVEKSDLKFYRQKFEKRFLGETENYYTTEADDFLQQNPFTEYMKKIEKRLNEEAERCNFYLQTSTLQPLSQICETVFIQRKIELFQRDFGPLLEQERDDDLARIYQLCGRIEQGLEELKLALERHITRQGQNAIDEIAKKSPNDPREFMRGILEVHMRYKGLVSKSFQNEAGFNQALDKASSNFINKNAITKIAGNSSSKGPELIARYCDLLLRKSKDNIGEAEMEEQLQNVIAVFKYIEDKDVFQQFYTKMFSKRLIGGLSASDTAESQMISKLKQMCGFEYTSKLQRMFTDTELSKNITENFRKNCQEKDIALGLDFTIMVLGYSSWPSMPQLQMQMPLKLSETIEHFKNYYNTQHNGRKLSWIYSQSRGELSSTGFQKKYGFQAWTAQMAVLMLYNEAPKQALNLKEMMLQLNTLKEQLVPVVGSLLKNDLLKCDDVAAGTEIENEIADTAVFTLDPNFQSKKIKVDLTRTQMRSEVKKEAEKDKKCIEEDRRLVIEACIVRIMKTRKRLAHNELISEVLQQLSTRFTPNVMKVRTSIEGLMERLFLKRAEDTMNVYEYIA